MNDDEKKDQWHHHAFCQDPFFVHADIEKQSENIVDMRVLYT